MQNQVPLWVTLTLGLIAIMGPIGGALIGGMITARRDDQRWLRELEREEARWVHENERDDHKYWLELRTVSYGTVIEKWQQHLRDAGPLIHSLRRSLENGKSS